jgi:eukaryotic-like serine/threonine-protein kinase
MIRMSHDSSRRSPASATTAEGPTWGGLYSVRSDGTGPRKLASTGADIHHIAWSPDGRVIRFSMEDKLWEIAPNGSNLNEFLHGWRPSSARCCGRWTPDGSLFLFLSGDQIWALDERHGLFRQPPAEPVQLTTGPMLWEGPISGKEGNRIFSEGTIPRGELLRFDAKTKRFLPYLGGISAQGVVFSKDGKSIAYVSYPEEILWKANRDGSNPVQLTDPPMRAFLPRWSPDGTQIAFTVSERRNYTVSPEGGVPRRLFPEDKGWEGPLTWSPDGRKIVFNWESPDGKEGGVRILDLESRQPTTVPGSGDMNGPRWSPYGRYLAAGSGDGDNLKIFNFQTQQWSELVRKGPVDSPEWSRDGQFIYFRRVRGDLGVFRIRVSGGAAEKIADLKDWHDAGWWGRYMGLDPTDAPRRSKL